MLVSSIFFVSTLIYSTLGYAVPQSPQPSSVAPPDLKDPKILDALLSYSERPTVPADDTSSGGDVFTMASAGSAECYRSGWHAHRDRLIDVVTRFCNQNGGLGVPNDYPPGVFMSEYQGEINGRPLVINTGYRNTHGSGTWMIRTDECLQWMYEIINACTNDEGMCRGGKFFTSSGHVYVDPQNTRCVLTPRSSGPNSPGYMPHDGC